MRQRIAAKVLCRELDEYYGYRGSTIQRAARRMRRRRLWSRKRWSYCCAALTATFMRKFDCSVDAVRFGLEGGQFNQRLAALSPTPPEQADE